MTVRKAPKRPQPAGPQKRLPRGRGVLNLLLRNVEKVLDFLEPAHHRQRLRLREVQKGIKDPAHILEQRPFLHQITAASSEQFARGGPPLTAVMDYIDAERFRATMARHQAAVQALAGVLNRKPHALDDCRRVADALSELVSADEALLQIFRDLQRDVIAECDKSGPDSADEDEDREPNRPIRLPENPVVLRLAREINARLPEEKSKRSIAIQFTNGDVKQADNLLRQLRRYPHLLDTSRS